MSENLFDVPEQLSPRLAWLKSRVVYTRKTEFKSGDEDDDGIELFPWYAWTGAMKQEDAHLRDMAGGATEDDAIAALARKKYWRLWNEQEFARKK